MRHVAHNGVDIVDFVLYTIYPTAAFFAVGFIAKATRMRQFYMYIIQAAICFAFAGAYFVAVPQGGAQGLAIILVMFGALLAFMARKQKVQPEQSV
jgi:hypothetical protein